MEPVITTCTVCEFTWDARTWTKCPRCCGSHVPTDPSPAEIRLACQAVQATWTRADRHKRTVEAYRPGQVETAVVTRAGDGGGGCVWECGGMSEYQKIRIRELSSEVVHLRQELEAARAEIERLRSELDTAQSRAICELASDDEAEHECGWQVCGICWNNACAAHKKVQDVLREERDTCRALLREEVAHLKATGALGEFWVDWIERAREAGQ